MYPDVSYLLQDIIGITPDNLTAIFKTYGIFLFLGIYIASKIFEKETKRKLGFLFEEGPRKALPPNFRNNILFIVAVAGIVGSKIIVLIEEYEVFYNNDIIDAIFRKIGISFYGGLIGAAIALIFYIKKAKMNILPALDATAPAILIGYSLGRLGCHFSGDGDWGIASGVQPNWWLLPDWMWSYNYPHNVANRGSWIENCDFNYCKVLDIAVFPTSAYESIICLFIFIFFISKIWIALPGTVFSIYLILSSIERFFNEFIRINKKHDFFGVVLSQAQFISIILVLLAFGLLLILYRHKIMKGLWFLFNK